MNIRHSTAVDQAKPARPRDYAALRELRVLYIDDHLETREVVFEVLDAAGAQMKLAATVAEGLDAISTFQPQVILCDIAMPGEDGYTFARKLRARQRTDSAAEIPALALTALTTEADRQRALAAGFQMHVAKPIDIDSLKEAVVVLSEWPRRALSPASP